MSKVAHLQNQNTVAVECMHFMSHKCSCTLPACSDDAHHLRKTVASCESYCQSPQFQEGFNVVDTTRNLPYASVCSHPRCTCSTESGSVSATCHSACVCHRTSKPPENLVHFVRHCNSVNDVQTDLSYIQHCCTCVHSLGMSTCHRDVMLSSITTSLCPCCTKCLQVKRRDECESQLMSRHSDSDLHSIQETQEKTVDNPRRVHTGNVIMDVREWQRWHIEHLDRQKLEVYVTFFVNEVCYLEK